jgi:hypothetical protein
MTLRFSAVFADAAAMWRANREVLLAVAGMFFFAPVFAFNLFIPMPDLKGITDQEGLYPVVIGWYTANLVWVLGSLLIQAFGSAVVLRLLLDGSRPTVAQAISAVTRLIPALLIAMIGSAVLMFGGFLLFFVPGMYAYGRCYLVWAVIVAEPQHGVVDGFVEGLKRTHGMGWRLFALGMSVVLPFYLVAQIIGGLLTGLEAAGPVGLIVSAVVIAAISAMTAIAQLLLQAGAYREIRQGT